MDTTKIAKVTKTTTQEKTFFFVSVVFFVVQEEPAFVIFLALPADMQRAIACHELHHVARGDWDWIVVEELARGVCWFHPGVWWLLDRIQLTREQLVDRLVVARLPSRRAYMTALMSYADAPGVVAPATAFLRKRHLRSRLELLAKESVMSRTRLVSTAVVAMAVIGAAMAGVVRIIPLDVPAFAQMRASAVGLANPVDTPSPAQQSGNAQDPAVTLPVPISRVNPVYTPEALREKIEGTVVLTTVVGTDGLPSSVEVVKSLDTMYGLDLQAVAALEQWRFEPGRRNGQPARVLVTVEMTFTLE